jgi:hypothetical protein
MEKYAHPIIEQIMKESDNKNCADCGTVYPKWASVNNGIFLCLNCAGVHRGLGVNISFVRSLTMDNWDEKQLKFIKAGGNRRFKVILEEYSIPNNTEIELKYNLNAINYYRLLLRNEILGETLPEKPDLINGLEKISTKQKGIVIFNLDVKIENNNFISCDNYRTEIPKKKKEGFFDKVGSFFMKTKEDINIKIKEMNIPEKFDKTTSYLDKKTKEVIVIQYFIFRNLNLFKR